ncbi:MAG: geranylgeranyl reductase family protein, partial [Promethearchaeia archaeon]
GHSVLLLDRKEKDLIGKKTCGDALGYHHIDELKELIGFPDLPEGIVEHQVKGMHLWAPDRKHKLRLEGPTTRGCSFNRLKLGQWMVSLAEEQGAEVRTETSAVALVFDDDRAVDGVTIRGPEETEVLRSDIVVDATGAAGVLRRQAPDSSLIEKKVFKQDQMAAWRCIYETPSYEFEEPDILDIYWNQDVTRGGYTWVFPQGKHRVNVGLGLMMLAGYGNPRAIYQDWVPETWEFMKTDKVVLDCSGGTAPVRRPIDTMVDDSFMLVGDAACQVNPVHGGGIGSSMLGGAHAGRTASRCLNEGDTSKENMWSYNIDYMESYGIKQASLDLFRWFLLNIENEDINYAFRKGIVKSDDLLQVSMTGMLQIGIVEKLNRLVSGLSRIGLVQRVNKIASLMDEIKALYRQYPRNPEDLKAWKLKLNPLYEAAKVL